MANGKCQIANGKCEGGTDRGQDHQSRPWGSFLLSPREGHALFDGLLPLGGEGGEPTLCPAVGGHRALLFLGRCRSLSFRIRQSKIDGDGCSDRSLERFGKLPLSDRVDGRFRQGGRTAFYFNIGNTAFLVQGYLQDYVALDVSGLCFPRIDGRNSFYRLGSECPFSVYARRP